MQRSSRNRYLHTNVFHVFRRTSDVYTCTDELSVSAPRRWHDDRQTVVGPALVARARGREGGRRVDLGRRAYIYDFAAMEF